jgi:hypothetical protein
LTLSAGVLKNPNLLEKIETGDEDLGLPLYTRNKLLKSEMEES